jgi:hypothetical protein
MTLSFRRLITGHDADGKSTLIDDRRVAEGALGNFNFWATHSDTMDGDQSIPFFPAPGGAIFRIFRLPPPDSKATREDVDTLAKEFFAGTGSPDCKLDTSRHPLMHVTPTTDYVMLLSGSVSLLLDEGEPIPLRPFDAVVQRTTNHAWIVTGDEPAILVCVMTGVEPRSRA